MKIYAVIDTNVIISALLSRNNDSATVRIMEHLYDRNIIPVYNDEILEEYESVLRRPKSYLVTGNIKHFPKKPFVVTPAEMLQVIYQAQLPRSGMLSEPCASYGKNRSSIWHI